MVVVEIWILTFFRWQILVRCQYERCRSVHTVDKVHTVESREMKDEKCNLELTCRHYISSQVNCKSLRHHLTHVACVRVGTGTALTTGTS